MQNPLSWAELPVKDLDTGMAFYSRVLDTEMTAQEMGGEAVSSIPGERGAASANLFVAEAAPMRIFLTIADLDAASTRCREAGGEVTSGVIDIPPGRFVHATDPDGNAIGLFEPRG